MFTCASYLRCFDTNIDRSRRATSANATTAATYVRSSYRLADLRCGGGVTVVVRCRVMRCWLSCDGTLEPLLLDLALDLTLSLLRGTANRIEFLLFLSLAINLCLCLGL